MSKKVPNAARGLKMVTLKVSGCEVQVLSDKVRNLNIQGVVYHVIDVYIPGQGAASVFMNEGQVFADLSGFIIGVYKNRLSVVPVFHTAEVSAVIK